MQRGWGWVGWVCAVAVAGGCTLLIPETTFREATDGGDAGAMDAGVGPDSGGPDGGPDGPALRCAPVDSPTTLCMASLSAPAAVVLPSRAIRPRLSLSVVEDGAGLAAASGLMSESGVGAWIVYNELAADGPRAVPSESLDLPTLIRAFAGPPQPAGTRSLAARRTAPETLALTVLTNDADMAPGGLSEVWNATLTGRALTDAANYSESAFLQYGEVAVTGEHGTASARHFWRVAPPAEFALASLPHGRWRGRSWRSTQAGVSDIAGVQRMAGSDGSFIAVAGETTSRVLLWTGLGASASMPTFVDAATPTYDFGASHTLVSFDLAWVEGERYVLGLVLDDGAGLLARLVPADCRVACVMGDPEVCNTGCTFGDAVDLPLGGAAGARIALAGAGPGVAVAIAREGGGSWEVSLTVRDPITLDVMTGGEAAPLTFTLASSPAAIDDLVISSLARSSDLDVAIGVLRPEAGGRALDLVSLRACLCR